MQNSTDVLFSLGTDILPFSIGQCYCFPPELFTWLVMKMKLPDIGF